MPTRPSRPCTEPGCPVLVQGGRCPAHLSAVRKKVDAQRGTSTERGYGTRWRKARATYLKRHPLCVLCEAERRITPATVVDHIIPHKGDSALFWDTGNWQSLCKTHHDSKTAREDGRWG